MIRYDARRYAAIRYNTLRYDIIDTDMKCISDHCDWLHLPPADTIRYDTIRRARARSKNTLKKTTPTDTARTERGGSCNSVQRAERETDRARPGGQEHRYIRKRPNFRRKMLEKRPRGGKKVHSLYGNPVVKRIYNPLPPYISQKFLRQ